MQRTFRIVVLSAIVFVGLSAGSIVHAVDTKADVILRARGNPYLLDFQVLSNKRADLRINLIRKGLNVAFTEWLRNERPLVYRHYAAQPAVTTDAPSIRTAWHPLLNDFLVLSNKRADLRLEMARKGLDAAFTEWLRRERPNVKR